jgi:hypothetical protein
MTVRALPIRARVAVPALALAVLLSTLVASGCSGVPTSWVPDGGALTSAQVDELAKNTDLSSASAVSIADAPDRRTEVLVWLRRRGADGGRAASLLTKGFPDRTEAIPVLVELAMVDGVRSLVVVEAAPGVEGELTAKRLWLFRFESGTLVRSATFH